MTTLLWLRDDLRLADHEALSAACADGGPVVALWVDEHTDQDVPGHDGTRQDGTRLDEASEATPRDDLAPRVGPRPLGGALRWWYHRSLEELGARLAEELGIPLVFASGDARDLVPRIAAGLGAATVRWSRRYAPGARTVDAAVKARLAQGAVEAHSHPGALLVEPWLVQTGAGHPYSVFTPFHRAAAEHEVDPPLPVPPAPDPVPRTVGDAVAGLVQEGTLVAELDRLALLDRRPPWWEDTLARHWEPGEEAALAALAELEHGVGGYADSRDRPADPDSTSRLSPRLRSGELSPRTLVHAARALAVAPEDRAAWVRQLYWREFCWHVTYHVPDLDWRPLRPEYAAFPYEPDPEVQRAWRRGRTGFGMVDAGMAQLWQTGWMHNRARMVTASLFTKNLLQPWQDGEAWFWDTLVDADEANNPVSWQWVAGSGADAAPYFRVFNPERQAERFDPDGAYESRWAPQADGAEADVGGGVLLGRPEPIVDLKASRRDALEAHAAMLQARDAAAASARES